MKACRPLRNNAKSLGEAVARHLNFSDGLVLKKKPTIYSLSDQSTHSIS